MKTDFSIVRGTDIVMSGSVANADMTPIDISGWTVTATAKDSKHRNAGTGTVTITDALNGVYSVHFAGSVTGLWEAGYVSIIIWYTDDAEIVTSTRPIMIKTE